MATQAADEIEVEGEMIAGLRFAGIGDREVLENWLSAGVLALRLDTPNGTVVAHVRVPTPGASPYGNLVFERPEDWVESGGADPRSNLRIRNRQVPLRMVTLGHHLNAALGIGRIDAVSAYFTRRTAAAILHRQDAVLARLGNVDPSSLRLHVCIIGDQVKLGRVEDQGTRTVLLRPAECP